jgi:hypothetical protein
MFTRFLLSLRRIILTFVIGTGKKAKSTALTLMGVNPTGGRSGANSGGLNTLMYDCSQIASHYRVIFVSNLARKIKIFFLDILRTKRGFPKGTPLFYLRREYYGNEQEFISAACNKERHSADEQ